MEIRNDILSCQSCVYRELLFGGLSEFEYKLVNEARTESLYSRGEIISHEGETVNSFIYLRKGLVKLYKTDFQRNEYILSINKPGDFVNLLNIFSGLDYRYSIRALEETMVCTIDLNVFLHIIKTNGSFSLRVLNKMSKIADDIIDSRFEQSQMQVKARIANLLLYFAEKIYHSDQFELPVKRREIAELLSITTENTIRTFSEFRKDGLVAMEGKTITQLDKNRLKEIIKNGQKKAMIVRSCLQKFY